MIATSAAICTSDVTVFLIANTTVATVVAVVVVIVIVVAVVLQK